MMIHTNLASHLKATPKPETTVSHEKTEEEEGQKLQIQETW